MKRGSRGVSRLLSSVAETTAATRLVHADWALREGTVLLSLEEVLVGLALKAVGVAGELGLEVGQAETTLLVGVDEIVVWVVRLDEQRVESRLTELHEERTGEKGGSATDLIEERAKLGLQDLAKVLADGTGAVKLVVALLGPLVERVV